MQAGPANQGMENLMVKMMGVRCTQCGSEEAGHDANASWDTARQEWTLASAQDQHWCPNCGEVEHEHYELRGQELADAMHARRLAGADEFIARLRHELNNGGAVGNLVLPELIEAACAIRSKLYQFAATMAEQDELVDALALTIPYAETRAEDLANLVDSEPESLDCPGHAEAASVTAYAERVLTQHGGKPYLLERGQRAGVQP